MEELFISGRHFGRVPHQQSAIRLLTVYSDTDIIYIDIRYLPGYYDEFIVFQYSIFGSYSAAELFVYSLDAQKGIRSYGYDTLGIFKTYRAKRHRRSA